MPPLHGSSCTKNFLPKAKWPVSHHRGLKWNLIYVMKLMRTWTTCFFSVDGPVITGMPYKTGGHPGLTPLVWDHQFEQIYAVHKEANGSKKGENDYICHHNNSNIPNLENKEWKDFLSSPSNSSIQFKYTKDHITQRILKLNRITEKYNKCIDRLIG